jgi:hypothetical protein
MLDSKSLGAPLVEALETQGVLTGGRKIPYALGLVNTTYKGVKDISHGGSTAGYQTFLARYPEKKLSVAVLCNGTSPSAGGLAASITDEILGPFPDPPKQPDGVQVPEDRLKKFVGIWRNEKTRTPGRFAFENGGLRFNNTPLKPMSDGTFMLGDTRIKFTFDKDGRPILGESNDEGEITRFIAEREWTPSAAELAPFAGDWHSEEAQSTVTFAVEGEQAFIVQRPTLRLPLRPLYKDHFGTPGYVIWVTRDASGKIDTMHVGGGRMRDMPFERVRK